MCNTGHSWQLGSGNQAAEPGPDRPRAACQECQAPPGPASHHQTPENISAKILITHYDK